MSTPGRPLSSGCCLLVATLGARILGFLPRRFCAWGTNVVAGICWHASRTYRRNVIANLRQVLGPDVPHEQVESLARAAFRTSARNIEELLWLRFVPTARLVERVHLARGDWSILDRQLERGRGVVVMTGHIGAFDLLGHVLAGRGFRLTAVAGRTLPRPLYDAAIELRGAHGMTVVEASPRGIRRLVETLRAGECVGFVGDRDFFSNGIAIEIFGRQTTLPSGAVRLARATGAPIVAAYARRTALGYEIELEEPFWVERTADRAADIRCGMERVVASLTRAIRAGPGDWVVFQPVWPQAESPRTE